MVRDRFAYTQRCEASGSRARMVGCGVYHLYNIITVYLFGQLVYTVSTAVQVLAAGGKRQRIYIRVLYIIIIVIILCSYMTNCIIYYYVGNYSDGNGSIVIYYILCIYLGSFKLQTRSDIPIHGTSGAITRRPRAA